MEAQESGRRRGSAYRELALVVTAGLIGFGGAWLGSHAIIVSQRDQARETRQAEVRSKRAETYFGFLKAADRYSIADETFQSEQHKAPDPLKHPCTTGKLRTCGILNSVFRDWVKARNDFTDALNVVYIYGSAKGVAAARRLAETLPSSLNDEHGLPDYKAPLNPNQYFGVHQAFLNVMCSDVSADPRPAC